MYNKATVTAVASSYSVLDAAQDRREMLVKREEEVPGLLYSASWWHPACHATR